MHSGVMSIWFVDSASDIFRHSFHYDDWGACAESRLIVRVLFVQLYNEDVKIFKTESLTLLMSATIKFDTDHLVDHQAV